MVTGHFFDRRGHSSCWKPNNNKSHATAYNIHEKKEKPGNVLLISKIKPVDEFMLVVTVCVA